MRLPREDRGMIRKNLNTYLCINLSLKNSFYFAEIMEFKGFWSLILTLLVTYGFVISSSLNEKISNDLKSTIEGFSGGARCGRSQYSKFSHRIAGGKVSKPGMFPSFVRILTIGLFNTKGNCGGVIISKDLVLTAAHCLEQYPLYVEVRAGIVGKGIPPEQTIVASKVCNPIPFLSIFGAGRRDVGVLRMSQEFNFTENVQPACIASKELEDQNYNIAIGAGKTRDDDEFGQALKYTLLDKGCGDRFAGAPTSNDSICYLPKENSIICVGDSGSGLYTTSNTKHGIRQFVTGVASFARYPDYASCSERSDVGIFYTDLVRKRDLMLELIQTCSS